MNKTWELKTEYELLSLGSRLGALLKKGAFVALYGDLGAGKTVLARGIGSAFGVERMNSPTFTIVQQYHTEPPLYHFDAYRLENSLELYAMGYADYDDGIILMEWANLVNDALPKDRLDVFIEGSGDAPRLLTMVPRGKVYEEIVERL
ncbi:MAG: tRNA (adenosine(37)-N6)-threonylcarbamoyltransferase complex ATPase subunit type 1 TsaE [Eubacteriales bacterium]|nr:tRNA (adenosine(37)-N6)-threonylcarbamoyltransferase complex ATPase subunit type 1 TsaE [Eubacteriales bacterium]